MTEDQFIAQLKKTARPQALWGKLMGIDQSVISLVINGRRDVPQSIVDAMGFERIVTYRKKPVPFKRSL